MDGNCKEVQMSKKEPSLSIDIHAGMQRPLRVGYGAMTAVLFDVDGTLLDSADYVLGAVEHTLRVHGRTPPPRAEIGTIMGPPLDECYRRLASDLDPSTLCATHRAWQRERMNLTKPFPGAVETVRALRKAGMRCGAVTARSNVSSLGTLEGAGLGGLLDVVISAEDTPRTKPFPDPIFAALDRMKVPAAEAVMVGDTAADIEAGRAAGVRTVGALYGFFGEKLRESRPDFLLNDISELPALLGLVTP